MRQWNLNENVTKRKRSGIEFEWTQQPQWNELNCFSFFQSIIEIYKIHPHISPLLPQIYFYFIHFAFTP